MHAKWAHLTFIINSGIIPLDFFSLFKKWHPPADCNSKAQCNNDMRAGSTPKPLLKIRNYVPWHNIMHLFSPDGVNISYNLAMQLLRQLLLNDNDRPASQKMSLTLTRLSCALPWVASKSCINPPADLAYISRNNSDILLASHPVSKLITSYIWN